MFIYLFWWRGTCHSTRTEVRGQIGEWVLSFHHVATRQQIQVFGLGIRYLHWLSYLVSPLLVVFDACWPFGFAHLSKWVCHCLPFLPCCFTPVAALRHHVHLWQMRFLSHEFPFESLSNISNKCKTHLLIILWWSLWIFCFYLSGPWEALSQEPILSFLKTPSVSSVHWASSLPPHAATSGLCSKLPHGVEFSQSH